MSCNYYRGKCLFLNGKEDGCNGCPIKKAYNKGVRDTKKDYERPTGEWIDHSEDEGYLECPICGCLTNCYGNKEELHYCWNCGADMRFKNELGGKHDNLR